MKKERKERYGNSAQERGVREKKMTVKEKAGGGIQYM